MQILSLATVALFAQLVFLYCFGVILKSAPEWRTDNTALYYALSIDQLVTPLGKFLYQFPGLLKVLTISVFWFEVLGPLLLFSPVLTGPIRTVGVFGFISLHLGIFLTLSIGFFPWISVLSMVCFLPAWFWDKSLALVGAVFPRRLRRIGSSQPMLPQRVRTRLSPFSARWLSPLVMQRAQALGGISQSSVARLRNSPAAPLSGQTDDAGSTQLSGDTPPGDNSSPAEDRHQAEQALGLRPSLWASLFVAFCLAWVFLWNVSTVTAFSIPRPARVVGSLLRLDQEWRLFAPSPYKDDGWYVIPGTLRDGTQSDMLAVTRGDLTHHPVTWEKPPMVSRTFEDHRWSRYLRVLRTPRHRNQRAELGRFICREWNSGHSGSEPLDSLQIYYMLETTQPDYRTAPSERKLLGEHRCS